MKMHVNGKVANMIIDTGASHTVFDKKRMIKFIGKTKFTKLKNSTSGIGGTKMDSHHTMIDRLKFGKLKLDGYPGVMLDLSHVNKAFKRMGMAEVDGVLGADIFMMFNAVIDYEKKTLKLNDTAFNKKIAEVMKMINQEDLKIKIEEANKKQAAKAKAKIKLKSKK